MMFAQSTDLPAVPSETLKWVLVILVAIVLVGCVIYATVRSGRESKPTRIADDPPPEFRKAAKRFNHDLSEERFRNHEQRLAALEVWRNDFIPQMEKDRRALVEQNESRASRIHEHIEKDRIEMDRKIDGIFDRILATLRNMGKL